MLVQFAVLSLFAVGGACTVVPEMQRQMVEIRGWLTDRQFSELYAIAQAAPGPNVMFVALLGHFIAGVPGAIVATVAMCGPTGLLAFVVSRVFERFRAARLTVAIQAGLVPVTIGLIAASALIIARASDHGWSRCGHCGDLCARNLDEALAADRARGRRRPRPRRIRLTN
jgi:chromate transporter